MTKTLHQPITCSKAKTAATVAPAASFLPTTDRNGKLGANGVSEWCGLVSSTIRQGEHMALTCGLVAAHALAAAETTSEDRDQNGE